ncbi:LysR family transcriptional regulator [uncultured Hoeflea sp.]|uniref:LysR family transcriptional regulator n=1 Tax=uncultured Hoeflea sp. TaxID=538666 RepID=UPI0030D9AA62
MSTSLLNRRLLHFLTVYETGNIKRAADLINISQPALSMSLRQLEEELGSELFQRQARGVVPTEAGEVLYRYASSIRQSARLAGEEIVALASGRLSRLRLGAGVAWTTTVLPDVLINLQRQFEGMSIDMVTGVGDQLAALFLAGNIDVLLAAGSMPRLDAPDIEKEFIANLPMLAVAGREHRLARRKLVHPDDLVCNVWAGFYEDEGFFHLAQHYMALRGMPAPKIAVRTNSAAALTAIVGSSEMIAILIAPLAHSASKAGLCALPLSEPLWEMPVNIYYRRVASELGVIRTFCDAVSERIKKLV